jgi:putative transposase
LRRLDTAFHAFFRRVNAGDKPGYPRFRGRGRYDTVVFPSYGDGCKLRDGRAYFQHIGAVKLKLHRPLAGRIKTMSFKREADGWYVVCSCDRGDVAVAPSTNPVVGIDLGLKAFLATAEDESVPPPKFYRAAQRKRRRAQRHLSRRQKGSQRRQKAQARVARLHQHIGNQCRDWHHKTALTLVTRYGTIAHETQHIRGIARTRLAKSTLDAGWRQFLGILTHKAEGAGVSVVAVDARNTTQACSDCGCIPATPLTLRDRTYHCASCGFMADRDLNAALNIRNRLGWSRQTLTGAIASVV